MRLNLPLALALALVFIATTATGCSPAAPSLSPPIGPAEAAQCPIDADRATARGASADCGDREAVSAAVEAALRNHPEWIHQQLLAHPEWLVEMSQALREKQQASQAAQAKQALAANRDEIYFNDVDPAVGNPSGDVTVVEFFDVECPYCKGIAPDLRRLVNEDKGIRVVYKELPILGPMSVTAAKAALAAKNQGRYEAFHDALMADKTPEHQLTEAQIFEIARSAHIDVARLKRDMASPDIDTQIGANRALAVKLGVRGTPGLIIGDALTRGAMPYEAMHEAVIAARTHQTTGQ